MECATLVPNATGARDLGSVNALKWAATACLIVGFGMVSAGQFAWIYLQLFGGVLWLTASVIMRDVPLIVTNGIMTAAGIAGLAYSNWIG